VVMDMSTRRGPQSARARDSRHHGASWHTSTWLREILSSRRRDEPASAATSASRPADVRLLPDRFKQRKEQRRRAPAAAASHRHTPPRQSRLLHTQRPYLTLRACSWLADTTSSHSI
jgi:hypothetical protein